MKPNGEEGSDSSGYGSTIYATPAATLLLKENVSLRACANRLATFRS
jgi:hypothetical protein